MSSFKNFSKAHSAPSKDGTGGKPKDATIPQDSPKSDKSATQPNNALANDMTRYGIARVPADYYLYGAFRYTNLEDAIEEAKRASPI